MTLRKFTIVPMIALALFAVGCGADCESSCDDAKDCDDASEEEKDRDCGEFCGDLEQLAEDAGCEDQLDEFIDCLSDDVCSDDENRCRSEAMAYGTCTADYCMDPEHFDQCTSG